MRWNVLIYARTHARRKQRKATNQAGHALWNRRCRIGNSANGHTRARGDRYAPACMHTPPSRARTRRHLRAAAPAAAIRGVRISNIYISSNKSRRTPRASPCRAPPRSGVDSSERRLEHLTARCPAQRCRRRRTGTDGTGQRRITY